MSESPQTIQVESIHLRDVAEALPRTRLFAETPFNEIGGIDLVDRVTAKAGAVLVEAGKPVEFLLARPRGRNRRQAPRTGWNLDPGGHRHTPARALAKCPLLTARTASMFRIFAAQDAVLLRFSEQDFWSLLACCPAVRKIVLADSAHRVQTYPG